MVSATARPLSSNAWVMPSLRPRSPRTMWCPQQFVVRGQRAAVSAVRFADHRRLTVTVVSGSWGDSPGCLPLAHVGPARRRAGWGRPPNLLGLELDLDVYARRHVQPHQLVDGARRRIEH